MEPEEEAPPAPLPDILPETEPEATPLSPGTPLMEPDMEPDMLPEPDVTDEELGAMEELDEGLEDELPELPQQPANSAAPTGGVHRPMARLRMSIAPNCTGSMPS